MLMFSAVFQLAVFFHLFGFMEKSVTDICSVAVDHIFDTMDKSSMIELAKSLTNFRLVLEGEEERSRSANACERSAVF